MIQSTKTAVSLPTPLLKRCDRQAAGEITQRMNQVHGSVDDSEGRTVVRQMRRVQRGLALKDR